MNVRPVKQQVYSMTKIVSGTQYVFLSMSKWLIIYELDLTILLRESPCPHLAVIFDWFCRIS